MSGSGGSSRSRSRRRTGWLAAAAAVMLALGTALLDGSTAPATAAPASTQAVQAQEVSLRVGIAADQVADVANAAPMDGAKVIQYAWSAAANQRWQPEASLDGFYRFKNVNSGKCLNVAGASVADNAPIVQYSCGAAPNELWKLTPKAIGYQIVSKNSGKCLNVAGGVGSGHSLIQFTCSAPGAYNDVWLISWEPLST